MNIEIAIIDDEKIIRETYEKYVLKWAQKNNISCKISLFESSEEFIFNYEDYKNFNILLLDIEMKEINGVELAKKIRNKDKNIQIIFISGYSEYIGEGYDVEALNFLVKPIREDKLFDVPDGKIKLDKFDERKKPIWYTKDIDTHHDKDKESVPNGLYTSYHKRIDLDRELL